MKNIIDITDRKNIFSHIQIVRVKSVVRVFFLKPVSLKNENIFGKQAKTTAFTKYRYFLLGEKLVLETYM